MAIGLRPARDMRGRPIDLTSVVDLLDRIVGAWNPDAIWLFGSRARGEARPESDWDLLVVAPDEAVDVDDPLAAWRLTATSHVRSDVLLCGAADFREDRDTPNTIAYEAAHAGILLYER